MTITDTDNLLHVSKSGQTLRPYQHNSINRVAEKIQQGKKRIIFQLATGGGKTVTFAGLIHRYLSKFPASKVLVLVHREELLKQAARTIYNWYGIPAIPIVAGSKNLPDMQVYVGMVETVHNRIKKNPAFYQRMGLVIVDECHIGNFKKLYDSFPNSWIVGFSATPVSSSKKDPLKNYFEDIVCGISIPQLISIGSLVKNHTINVTNINRSELDIKNGEFDEGKMAQVFSGVRHVQNCVAAYQKVALGKKTLIFNCNIEHSKKVNDAFEAFGYPVKHLDSFASEYERSSTLAWFKQTPGAILNNVGILTTGFDEPSVEAIIVNKATMSLPLWLQMCGRGSRPFPLKSEFLIVDMGGNGVTHGDWCDEHDWSDLFFHPAKASAGGEAPSKSCIGCESVIPAGMIICKFCGAENRKKIVYDGGEVNIKELMTRRPIDIDVMSLIDEFRNKKKADGTPYKDISVLHQIKGRIIVHVSRVWKMKRIDDETANMLLRLYQGMVRQWCELKHLNYGWWHEKSTRDWLFAELKRVFKWEPTDQIKRA